MKCTAHLCPSKWVCKPKREKQWRMRALAHEMVEVSTRWSAPDHLLNLLTIVKRSWTGELCPCDRGTGPSISTLMCWKRRPGISNDCEGARTWNWTDDLLQETQSFSHITYSDPARWIHYWLDFLSLSHQNINHELPHKPATTNLVGLKDELVG